jgi:ribonucleoside-diphosphate reductase alpha chain
MDNPLLSLKNVALGETLKSLRDVAVLTNKEWAKKLGVPQSTAVTCVKPSGTVSQLVDSSSGIHARHNDYYIRTVRGDNKDPLTKFLKDSGVPSEPCVAKPETTTVFSFPTAAPEGSVTRNDLTAIEQLQQWMVFQENWCEHKPSVTISVRDGEWLEVGAFVFKHFDKISGVSFLPHSDYVYKQAPYQDITEEEYKSLVESFPKGINWDDLREYEEEDNTVSMQTMACSGDSCELVDIG